MKKGTIKKLYHLGVEQVDNGFIVNYTLVITDKKGDIAEDHKKVCNNADEVKATIDEALSGI